MEASPARRPRLAALFGAALLGLLLAGCDSLESCSLGDVRRCGCPMDGNGVQSCGPDGVYGECDCSPPIFDLGPPDDIGPDPRDAGPPPDDGPDEGPPDFGPDLGMPDLGMDPDLGVDGGPLDNGPLDNGPLDNGPLDNGPLDNGPLDNGPLDNGPLDNGPLDSGRPDLGPPDNGPPDAGATLDLGVDGGP